MMKVEHDALVCFLPTLSDSCFCFTAVLTLCDIARYP